MSPVGSAHSIAGSFVAVTNPDRSRSPVFAAFGDFLEVDLLTIAVPNTLHVVYRAAEVSRDGPQTQPLPFHSLNIGKIASDRAVTRTFSHDSGSRLIHVLGVFKCNVCVKHLIEHFSGFRLRTL